MAITYEQFASGQSLIQLATDGEKEMVLGWSVYRWDDEASKEVERLYALRGTGDVKCTANEYPSNNPHFDLAGRKWVDAVSVPNEAEFIGHYLCTMFQG